MSHPAPPPPPATSFGTQPPLSQPLRGASIGQAVTRFWKKYATFSGRASQSEFWWAYLVNVVIVVVLYVLMAVGGIAGATIDPSTGQSVPGPLIGVGAALILLFWLAVVVPTLAITWRRLHDTDRSGLFWLLGFIPFVGGILLLVFLAFGPNPAGARFDA